MMVQSRDDRTSRTNAHDNANVKYICHGTISSVIFSVLLLLQAYATRIHAAPLKQHTLHCPSWLVE